MKKKLEILKQFKDKEEDPYFTFSGDKKESLRLEGSKHHKSSQLTEAILPKNAAALFAQLDSQHLGSLDPNNKLNNINQGQPRGMFDDLSLEVQSLNVRKQ